MLVMMTTFSVQSIRKPYKHVHSLTATLCVALCWFVRLLVALIPVINTDELQKIFIKILRFEIKSPSLYCRLVLFHCVQNIENVLLCCCDAMR